MRHAIMHSWFIKLLNLACGDFHPCMSVCMLGLDVMVCQDGLECCPREEKIAKWSSEIEIALRDNHMSPGQASKLAGGLSWAAQNMFARYVYYHFIVHTHFPYSILCGIQVRKGHASSVVCTTIWQKSFLVEAIANRTEVVA